MEDGYALEGYGQIFHASSSVDWKCSGPVLVVFDHAEGVMLIVSTDSFLVEGRRLVGSYQSLKEIVPCFAAGNEFEDDASKLYW
jgi:hypothetical protein